MPVAKRLKANNIGDAIRMMNCHIVCRHYEQGCRPVKYLKDGSVCKDEKVKR